MALVCSAGRCEATIQLSVKDLHFRLKGIVPWFYYTGAIAAFHFCRLARPLRFTCRLVRPRRISCPLVQPQRLLKRTLCRLRRPMSCRLRRPTSCRLCRSLRLLTPTSRRLYRPMLCRLIRLLRISCHFRWPLCFCLLCRLMRLCRGASVTASLRRLEHFHSSSCHRAIAPGRAYVRSLYPNF